MASSLQWLFFMRDMLFGGIKTLLTHVENVCHGSHNKTIDNLKQLI